MPVSLEWFVEDAAVCEEGDDEWYAMGAQVNETTPAAVEADIVIFMHHYKMLANASS